jgi:hypothetical protein
LTIFFAQSSSDNPQNPTGQRKVGFKGGISIFLSRQRAGSSLCPTGALLLAVEGRDGSFSSLHPSIDVILRLLFNDHREHDLALLFEDEKFPGRTIPAA